MKKWILRQLAVYAFIALVFFLWGLKINWWANIDRAAMDCTKFKSFQHHEVFFGCYKITGSKDYGRD